MQLVVETDANTPTSRHVIKDRGQLTSRYVIKDRGQLAEIDRLLLVFEDARVKQAKINHALCKRKSLSKMAATKPEIGLHISLLS